MLLHGPVEGRNGTVQAFAEECSLLLHTCMRCCCVHSRIVRGHRGGPKLRGSGGRVFGEEGVQLQELVQGLLDALRQDLAFHNAWMQRLPNAMQALHEAWAWVRSAPPLPLLDQLSKLLSPFSVIKRLTVLIRQLHAGDVGLHAAQQAPLHVHLHNEEHARYWRESQSSLTGRGEHAVATACTGLP